MFKTVKIYITMIKTPVKSELFHPFPYYTILQYLAFTIHLFLKNSIKKKRKNILRIKGRILRNTNKKTKKVEILCKKKPKEK